MYMCENGRKGAAVRVKGRGVLWTCVLFALALLASLSLVERPVPLREAQELPPLTAAAFAVETRALPETGSAETELSLRQSGFAALTEAAASLPAAEPEQDANGCPLRGLRFVRARYQAFPLEDMPG